LAMALDLGNLGERAHSDNICLIIFNAIPIRWMRRILLSPNFLLFNRIIRNLLVVFCKELKLGGSLLRTQNVRHVKWHIYLCSQLRAIKIVWHIRQR